MKKIIVHTEYAPCSDEFVEEYINRLAQIPDASIRADLKSKGFAEYFSKDPTSKAIGKTTYQIVEFE